MRLAAVRSTPTGARLLVLGLAAALVVLTTGSARADEPSLNQLHEQQRKAAQLDRLAHQEVVKTRDAAGRLADLAAEAGKALDAYVTLRDAAFSARAEEAAQRELYDAARLLAIRERSTLGRIAAATYRNGGGANQMALLASLLASRSITDMGRGAADLEWAGNQQSYTLDRVRAAEAEAARAADAADAAKAKAEDAERRGRIAKERADQLVNAQRALVTALAEKARSTRNAARQAANEAAQMAHARQVAAQRRAAAERQRQAAVRRGEAVRFNATAAGSGACRGGDLSAYPNGEIPREMLCPLWGAEWHVLRADAAATFSSMSKAYAATFGRPICVTDSYRSYEMQVDVHRRKPGITATPGTSNHGWGTAVDLCDGVQSFNTTTYRWMQNNAPRFGWFHPSWADQGGSRPEPWHWEFGG
ncbi:MAG: M15 family metallopeptidase [Sporichthyaceae bacterium]